jgi:hypothetical protein
MNRQTGSQELNAADFSKFENFFKSEELDDELKQHLEEDELLGALLRHPLVYSVPHFEPLNHMMNKMLKQKKSMIEKAIEDRNWSRYITLHERAYRIEALEALWFSVALHCDFSCRWKLFREVWIDSETIGREIDRWNELIRSTDDHDEYREIMTEDDLESFDAMTFPITIYRGAIEGVNEEGLSWTVSRQKAEWFARRFSSSNAVVLVSTCDREEVVFITTERDEDEVVIHPDFLEDVVHRSESYAV